MANTGLRTPVPNIPLKDAIDQLWALATADLGDGTQAIKVELAGTSGSTVTVDDYGGSLDVGGKSQTVVTFAAGDRYAIVQNPSTAAGQNIAVAEPLYVAINLDATVANPDNAYELAPGASCTIGGPNSPMAVGTEINVNATTINHAFYVTMFKAA